MTEYKKAMWKWFAENATTPGRWHYSPLDPADRTHLVECGIDADYSWDPTVGSVEEWGNTENPFVARPALTTDVWRCNCGQYGSDSRNVTRCLTLAVTGDTSLGAILSGVLSAADALSSESD